MGVLEDDLTLWIESLENYLSNQKGGTDPRAAEIENLARQWEKAGDHERAAWIRRHTSADYIRNTARTCRAYIKHGKMDEVYSIRKRFERNRLPIEALLDQQHIRRGRKVVRAARAGHQAVHGDEAQKRDRWQRVHADFEAEKAKGTPKAALIVAERHGVSERQVYRSKAYLSKID
jgi:hypothetical protein